MKYSNTDYDKLVAVMLYILNAKNEVLDFTTLFKIMYFAERKHLSRYGRQIADDDYKALPYGPVPQKSYDILKELGQNTVRANEFSSIFEVKLHKYVKAKVKANIELLSESEIECLQESIDENIDLSFDELSSMSHDDAYNSTYPNQKMSPVVIARVEGANEEMIKYIELNIENNRQLVCA
jgi:uncharacterized phage-associated protein